MTMTICKHPPGHHTGRLCETAALKEIRALRRWAKKKATVPFGQDGMSSKQVFEFDLLEWAKTRERKLKGGKL